MKNNQKGITLVALVITIIVLLILAGVTIAALSGDNGILTRGSQAKQDDEIGAAKDTVNLAANEAIQEYYNVMYNAGTHASVVNNDPQATVKNFVAKAVGITDAVTEGKVGNAKVTITGITTVTVTSSDGKASAIGTISTSGAVSWGPTSR